MGEDVRARLIGAAEMLMRSGRRAETLTSRELAAAAGTSAGLINYHFGSKDELLARAAERLFADFDPRWERVARAAKEAAEAARARGTDDAGAAGAALDAGKAELKNILKGLADASVLTAGGNDFGIKRELMEGEMAQVRFLAPILRAILPPGTDERELRWAAFMIVAPMQLVFLRHDFLSGWTGTDLDEKIERDAVLDFIIDRILEPFAAEAGAGSGNIR